MSLGELFGIPTTKDMLSIMRSKITEAFSSSPYDPDNAFYKAYGINGIYYSDLDNEFTAPLVVIQSADLARFVAIKQIAEKYLNTDEYNEEEIEKLRIKIGENYLIENGMSPETVAALRDIYED